MMLVSVQVNRIILEIAAVYYMKLTIFTPTYNRANCLINALDSLLRQTDHSFVWLIVDDGSTDNTKALVDDWISERIISIEYYYQQNAGKMAAHNWAAQLSKTELFMCLDSDDQLIDTAVEDVISFWEKHRNDRDDLLGIIAPKTIVNKEGLVVRNPEIPKGIEYTTGRGLYQSGYRGETAMVFRTEILRKYPFPVQEGEKFISEISAYDAMDEHYVMLAYNRPLMICEYQEDGYSNNLLKINVANPKGVVYVNQQRQKMLHRFSPTLMREYIAYSRIAKYSWNKIVLDSRYPIYCFLMLPWGFLKMKRLLQILKDNE